MEKSADEVVTPADERDYEILLDGRTGTLADKKAMARLGKEQQFKVSVLYFDNCGIHNIAAAQL